MEGWRERTRVSSVVSSPMDAFGGAGGGAAAAAAAAAAGLSNGGRSNVGVVTSLGFDVSHDLVWIGDSKGRVGSYQGSEGASGGLVGYTRFLVCDGSAVECVATTDRGIVVLCSNGVIKVYNRRGIIKQTISGPELKGSRTFCFGTRGRSEIIVGGDRPELIRVNVERGTISGVVDRRSGSATTSSSSGTTSPAPDAKANDNGNGNSSKGSGGKGNNNKGGGSKGNAANKGNSGSGSGKGSSGGSANSSSGSGVRKMCRNESGSVIVLGLESGRLEIVDGHSLRVLTSVQAHSGPVNDLACRGHTVVTCGTSLRKQGYMPDPLINVYDIRHPSRPKFLNPVAVPAGASYVCIHPKMTSQCVVVSPLGQMQFVDLGNHTAVQIRQLTIAPGLVVNGMAMSPSGDFLAISDSSGIIHLWDSGGTSAGSGGAGGPHFTEFAGVLEYPVYQSAEGLPYLSMDTTEDGYVAGPGSSDEGAAVPLSSVGMPYYKEELLSAWTTPNMVFSVGMRHMVIPNKLVAGAKDCGSYLIAPYSKEVYGPRNSVLCKARRRRTSVSVPVPQFLSERQRSGRPGVNGASAPSRKELFEEEEKTLKNKDRIPRMYRKLSIKYSKFGVNDFDFDYYNSTEYSGLETQVANAYCNALLQVLRYSKRVFNYALFHVATTQATKLTDFAPNAAAGGPPDLLCELGFLFDMLHKARGKHCRASNFVNCIKTIPQAAALGLVVEEDSVIENMGAVAQGFGRFLMEQLTKDDAQDDSGGGGSDHDGYFGNITGSRVSVRSRCTVCTNYNIRMTTTHSLELPRHFSRDSFPSHVLASLDKLSRVRGWCEKCGQYQTLLVSQQVMELAPVVTFNINLTEKRPQREILQRSSAMTNVEKRFEVVTSFASPLDVPPSAVGDSFSRGGGNSSRSSSGKMGNSASKAAGLSSVGNRSKYSLVGIVAEITEPEAHLVAVIKIDGQWYLFNDFLVAPLSEENALDFSVKWKTPVMLVYEKDSDGLKFDYDLWKRDMDVSVLYREMLINDPPAKSNLVAPPPLSASSSSSPVPITTTAAAPFRQLSSEERIGPGTLVAIDAEFVMLQHEETEIRSDGSKSVLKPQSLSLARVSVIRGDGPLKGTAFIDDFIATRDPVVDYLTKFSGIEPGDLDVHLSNKGLVSFQTAYRRLWVLLNMGCIFVGHGLLNDFRTINIQVPPEQVIDTLDIYYVSSRQRKLSLKFLAYSMLGEKVQKGNHDSIEDAMTALHLYYKYRELAEAGEFQKALDNVYKEGHKCNFKVPEN